MSPTVSIMLPCYNSARTLPWALASVMAQTFEDWECIIVDDGSTDQPEQVVRLVDDPRFRFHRFNHNRGRALARQFALDQSRGEYLAMVDADDWLYPDKLEIQIAAMETHRNLGVLSTDMAILDSNDHLVGIRQLSGSGHDLSMFEPLRNPSSVTIAHAPSVIRRSAAHDVQYDARFRVAEDTDFLLRLMMNADYGILHTVTYAYREEASYSLEKMLQSYASNKLMFARYWRQFPLAVSAQLIKLEIKELIYRAGHVLGFSEALIARRSQMATRDQSDAYLRSYAKVRMIGSRVFAGSQHATHFA